MTGSLSNIVKGLYLHLKLNDCVKTGVSCTRTVNEHCKTTITKIQYSLHCQKPRVIF